MKDYILISVAYYQDDFLEDLKSARIRVCINDKVTHEGILKRYSNIFIKDSEIFEKQIAQDVKHYIKEKQINVWYKDFEKLPIKIEYLGI